MNRTCQVAVVLAAAALVPDAATANRMFGQKDVVETGGGTFEVIGRIGDGAADYWCGAGDYAQRALRAGATERIYIRRGIGPSETRPGRKSVLFSLRPPPGGGEVAGYSLSVKAVGDNMTTTAAVQYCFDRIKFER